MKPKLTPKDHAWTCSGQGAHGWGRTPEAAYARWQLHLERNRRRSWQPPPRRARRIPAGTGPAGGSASATAAGNRPAGAPDPAEKP